MKKIILFIVSTLIVNISCDNSTKYDSIPRIIISTDIGGSDPDDYQSLVHFLVYADEFDIEGLISSPPHEGRKEHIVEVIETYRTE